MTKKPKKKTTKDSLEVIDVNISRDEIEETEEENKDEDDFESILNEVLDMVFKNVDKEES
tara:strand:- start:59 stop:238 length:180 start_codon:yes stop_codon:yes gene_type:complete